MPLFRALAKNMAPMTNADESPTNRLTLFPIYLSLFIVSTLCLYYTAKNATDLLQIVNFTDLLQLVNKLQQACQFHKVATSMLK